MSGSLPPASSNAATILKVDKEVLEKVGVKNENANDYVEWCYDTLMYLIRARLYLDGYSTNGLGAREAEISYLLELKVNEREVQFINHIRYFRK